MTQFGSGLDLTTKRTRKWEFLTEMDSVVPWLRLIALIEPHYRANENEARANAVDLYESTQRRIERR